MRNYSAEIKNAKTLSELCDVLNDYRNAFDENGYCYEDQYIIDTIQRDYDAEDFSSLPTFGDKDIEDTIEVWSWDDTHYIEQGEDCWEIRERCSVCGEAPFHCSCEEN